MNNLLANRTQVQTAVQRLGLSWTGPWVLFEVACTNRRLRWEPFS